MSVSRAWYNPTWAHLFGSLVILNGVDIVVYTIEEYLKENMKLQSAPGDPNAIVTLTRPLLWKGFCERSTKVLSVTTRKKLVEPMNINMGVRTCVSKNSTANYTEITAATSYTIPGMKGPIYIHNAEYTFSDRDQR